MSGQRAVAIERVSTGQQTAALQSPEITARVRERGYDLRRTFTLTASASKGRQQGVLDAVLDGAKRGEWSVVLCVAIDRVERRGVFALRGWITDLHRAGARLESTSPGEEWLTDFHDELIWSIRLDLEADRARRESELRKERTARGHARKDELGQGRVKLPLGWRYDKRDRFDSSVVTDEPAMQAVREAFRLAATGSTLQAIARAMTDLGYPRTAEGVGLMLRMPCYGTGELYVPVPVSVEQAVTPELQQQAVALLEARRTYTGPRTINVDAADFSGRIFCYEHGTHLHRKPGPARKDGSRRRYYRARSGKGEECGCGLYDADTVDDLVNRLLLTDDEPETEMAVSGDPAARLAQIEQESNRLYARKPAGWYERLGELEAEKKRLKDDGGTGWERRETGRLMGDVWRSMTRAEQRRYLERQCESRNWRVLIEKSGKQLRAVWRPFGFEHSGAFSNVERYAGPVSLRSAGRHVQKTEISGS